MAQIKKSSPGPLTFLLVLSSDHLTGATGKTPAVELSKNGGAYAAAVGAVEEIGYGVYQVADAGNTDTLGPLWLHADADGCDPVDERYEVVTFDPQTGAQQRNVSVERRIVNVSNQ